MASAREDSARAINSTRVPRTIREIRRVADKLWTVANMLIRQKNSSVPMNTAAINSPSSKYNKVTTRTLPIEQEQTFSQQEESQASWLDGNLVTLRKCSFGKFLFVVFFWWSLLTGGHLVIPGILPLYCIWKLSCGEGGGGGGGDADRGRRGRAEDSGFPFGDSVTASSNEVREYQHMGRNNPNALPLDGVYLATLSIARQKCSFKLKLKFAFKEKGWEIYSQTEPFLNEESMQRSQGFVNMQGDAYWVAHLDPSDDSSKLLLRGSFNLEQEQNEFVGEYLSKNGKHGKVTSIKYTWRKSSYRKHVLWMLN